MLKDATGLAAYDSHSIHDDLVPRHGGGDFRIAIVVDPDLPVGLLANTVATVSVGLGAMYPSTGRVPLIDGDGYAYSNSADRPVPILQAGGAAIQALMARAADRPKEATVVLFPAFCRALHTFTDYEAKVPHRSMKEEKIDGLGLCGPGKWVRSLTGSLKLLR